MNTNSPSAPVAELEVVSDDTKQVALLVQETGIAQDAAASLQTAFAPLFKQAKDTISQSRQITVTDVSQVLQMKIAREYRLVLKKIRIGSDAKRKELKDESLKRGRAIDGFHAILEHLVSEEEKRLDEAEKFAQRKEDERLDAQKLAREEALKPFGVDTSCIALRVMPQEQFNQFLENTKLAHEARIERDRKAEAARIQAENDRLKEEARLKEENERLKREADEREAAAKAEKERLEALAAAERKKAADAKKKADAAAAKAKAEADEAARAAAQKAKEDAEAAAAKAKAELEAKETEFRAQRKKEQDEAFAEAERVRKKIADEKAAFDVKLLEERVEREKAEAELRKKREEDAARIAVEEAAKADAARVAAEAAAKAKAAPDKHKLLALRLRVIALIDDLPMYSTPAGQEAGDAAEKAIAVCAEAINRIAEQL